MSKGGRFIALAASAILLPVVSLELRTGELPDSLAQDGITKSTLVAPLEESCPRWLQFLAETTGNDVGLIRFLKQWGGYCLTGVTREHALVFV